MPLACSSTLTPAHDIPINHPSSEHIYRGEREGLKKRRVVFLLNIFINFLEKFFFMIRNHELIKYHSNTNRTHTLNVVE